MSWVDDYTDAARDALTAFGGSYRAYGHYVAGYARAVDLCLNAPMHITVVGSFGDPRSHALLSAASPRYIFCSIVKSSIASMIYKIKLLITLSTIKYSLIRRVCHVSSY